MVCDNVWHVTPPWHLDIVCSDTPVHACMHMMHASGGGSTAQESVPVTDVSDFQQRCMLPTIRILGSGMSQYTNSHGLWWASGDFVAMHVCSLYLRHHCGCVSLTRCTADMRQTQFPAGKTHAKNANLHVWHAVHNAQLNAVISSNVTLFHICILLQFAQHTAANRVNLNLPFHWVTHADNKSWSMCDPCSMSDQLSEHSTDMWLAETVQRVSSSLCGPPSAG